jgi:hypothetical protein
MINDLTPLQDTLKLIEGIRSQERDDYGKDADLFDRATLLEIAKAVQGHPLAASNAIKYVIRVSCVFFLLLWPFDRRAANVIWHGTICSPILTQYR